MEVRIDGSCFSSENLLPSSLASSQELPSLSTEEKEVARKLGVSEEGYARSLYQGALTAKELHAKAERLGRYVQEWLSAKHLQGSVILVWLKMVEDSFRITIELNGKQLLVFVDECLVDGYFETGSEGLERRLSNVLALNLLPGTKAAVL